MRIVTGTAVDDESAPVAVAEAQEARDVTEIQNVLARKRSALEEIGRLIDETQRETDTNPDRQPGT